MMTEAQAIELMDKALDAFVNPDVHGAYLTVIHADGTRSERFVARDKELIWKMGCFNPPQKFNEEFPLKAQVEQRT